MKILLVRSDGIGDALACAPLIAALRDAGHTIGTVLGSGNAAIFARDTFARVHVLERIPWPAHGSTPGSRRIALCEVRAAGYDVALIASEELDAYAFAREAGIPIRVGFTNGWEKPFKSAHVRSLLTRAQRRSASAARARGHEVTALFSLGEGLHGEPSPTRDVNRLSAIVLDAPVERADYVALQVSAKFAAFGLNEAAYVALARRLADCDLPVMMLGDDAALVQRAARRAGVACEPGLDVAAWKLRIARGRALVTPDSGAAHVAGFVGVPCLDCFVPTRSTMRDIERWHPWAAPFRAHVLDATRSAQALAAGLASSLHALLERRALHAA